MSRQMDARTLELEANLNALYSQAVDEVRAEFARFTESFEAEDRRQSARVAEGEITPEQYARWRQNNIIRSDKYQATVNSLTTMLVNTDVAAMEITRGQLPIATAESYNFVQALGSAAAEDAGLSMGTFQIYNADSVQAIMRDNRELLPHVDIEEDQRWNHDRINREIVTGILTGDSIPKVADRLEAVTTMDRNAAVRNARTAMTGAENLGRRESADRLRAQGLPMKQVWSATYDSRTRDTHLMLDGTEADENGLFGVGILTTPLRYPGDPLGDPGEVYNCRCRLNIQIGTIDHSNDADLYEKFMRDNHPDDYAELQDRREERQEAAERREALLATNEFTAIEPPPKTIEEAQREQETPPVPEEPAIEYRGHITPEGEWFEELRGVSTMTETGIEGLMNDLGTDRETSEKLGNSVLAYSESENYRGIRAASMGESTDPEYREMADNIERFIEISPKWEGGEICRGMLLNNDIAEGILQRARNGEPIENQGISSWTSSRRIAESFASPFMTNRENKQPIILINEAPSTEYGTSIRHLSANYQEDEILVRSQTEFYPSRVEETPDAVIIYGEIRRIER